MSVYSFGASEARGALVVEPDAASPSAVNVRLPRHTLSARPAARSSRGLEAVLASLDRKTQLAVRQLVLERVEVLARKRAVLERLAEDGPHAPDNASVGSRATSRARGGEVPELLVTLNTKLADNESQLRRQAGTKEAADALMDALDQPEIAAAIQVAGSSEEAIPEGVDARVWRRKLNTRRPTGFPGAVTHNAPTATGGRDLFNKLESADPSEGLSYYQKQQQKYGRARRGSTSIAGAWEEVFGEDGSAPPVDAPDAAPEPEEPAYATAADARALMSSSIPGSAGRSPAPPSAVQKAAAELRSAAADALSPSPAAPPPARPAMVSPPPPPARRDPGKYSDMDVQSLLSRARYLSSGAVSAAEQPFTTANLETPASVGAAVNVRAPEPVPAAAPAAPMGVLDGFDAVGLAASVVDGGALEAFGADADAVDTNIYARIQPSSARSVSQQRKRRGSGASAATARKANTFFMLRTDGVLPLPRYTLSAVTAKQASRGVDALMNSFPKQLQHAVREMAIDIAELLQRKETLEHRLMQDGTRNPDDPPPKILLGIEEQLDERLKRLVKLAGEDGAALVFAEVNNPATREAMGLDCMAEEEVLPDGSATIHDAETAARVWRRRLDAAKVQPVRGIRGERAAVVHDDVTHLGARQLWNELNRKDPDEALSYYQKQQLKYGRARRGSTSIAGAWEQVFAPDAVEQLDATSSRGPNSNVVLNRAQSPRPTHITGAARGRSSSPLRHTLGVQPAVFSPSRASPRGGVSVAPRGSSVRMESFSGASVAGTSSPLLSMAHAAVAAARTAGDVDSLQRVAMQLQARLQSIAQQQ